MILTNSAGDPELVILSYTEYLALSRKKEALPTASFPTSLEKGLTSDELLDKINRDIAQWKETQNPMVELEEDSVTDDDEDDLMYFESVDQATT